MNKPNLYQIVRNTITRTVLLALAATVFGLCRQAYANHQPETQTLSNCRTATTEQHPLVEYETTMALLEKQEFDEAVYCFYRGQLRYRIHLSARPDLDPSADPALFGSMNGFLGAIVNGQAQNDLPSLVKTIDDVLEWHESSNDLFTPKEQFPEAHKEQREGLMRLREQFAENEDSTLD